MGIKKTKKKLVIIKRQVQLCFTVFCVDTENTSSSNKCSRFSFRLTEIVVTKLLIRAIRTVRTTIANLLSQNAHRPVSAQKVI